jgi:hypothetical protein
LQFSESVFRAFWLSATKSLVFAVHIRPLEVCFDIGDAAFGAAEEVFTIVEV